MMKFRHAAIGLALMGLPASAAAYQCSSKAINKGTAEYTHKVETRKQGKKTFYKKVTIYLPTSKPDKLVQLVLPGPLVDKIRKNDDNLEGIFYANATMAIAKFERGMKNAPGWRCTETPMELPPEETSKKESGSPVSPPVKRLITGDPDNEKGKKAEVKPGAPSEARPDRRFSSFSRKDWEEVRNKKVWFAFEIKGNPGSALEIKDDGKPWAYNRLGALSKKMKTHVNDAFNHVLKANPYTLGGTIKVKLQVGKDGYVKTVRFQGPAVEQELIEWLIKAFGRIVFSNDIMRNPEFDFVLKKPD